MRRYFVAGLAVVAILPVPASAEVPPRFELGLQCAAAATVSTMLLKNTKAPAQMQENYAAILNSVNGTLHSTASTAGMTDEQVDQEIVRRSDVLVDKINAVPDDAFQAAVFQQISMEADGGMAACSTLLNSLTIEKH